jgi:hypothetical protein
VIGGSLASPKPPDGGKPEEQGDEENEKESRGRFKAKVALARLKCDKTQAELAEHLGVYPFRSRTDAEVFLWIIIYRMQSVP